MRRIPHTPALLVLKPGHFLYVVAVLAVLGSIAYIFLHDPLADYVCEQQYIPSVQSRFGFRAGRVTLGEVGSFFAIVTVDDAGALAHAGFRAGDVPIAYHGGLPDFCYALHAAENGLDTDARSVTVVNASEWEHRSTRTLVIPVPSVR